jgi:hypothetical protein
VLLSKDMEPQPNKTEGVIAPLKKVTPVSKYLALVLFIIMPFIGGYVGYVYSPTKVVEVEKIVVVPEPAPVQEMTPSGSVNLCGKEFKIDDVLVGDINITKNLDRLLRGPLQAPDQRELGNSCEEFLTNVSDSTTFKQIVSKANYGFFEISSPEEFDAYTVQFVVSEEGGPIDVGFYVDKESYEVFRIVVLDSGKGLKVGELK